MVSVPLRNSNGNIVVKSSETDSAYPTKSEL